MGRIPCCEKDNVKRGQWTPEEDHKLTSYIAQHGTRNWRLIPKHAGLQRCGKSCRLRWTNYLRPDLKHGQFSDAEEQTIVTLHSVLGNRYFLSNNMIISHSIYLSINLLPFFHSLNMPSFVCVYLIGCNRWSVIAAQLPGRTDNDVKNHWNTKLKKKLSGMGIDPVTHKPFSHLITEIATTLSPPQVPHLAEAALGCFKDEMLHLLTKKRLGFQMQQFGVNSPTLPHVKHEDKAETIERIKYGLSRAIKDPDTLQTKKPWDQSEGPSRGFGSTSGAIPASVSGYHYSIPPLVNEWNPSTFAGSSTAGGDQQVQLDEKLEDESCGDSEGGNQKRDGSNIFNSDCVLWDLPSDDLMNPIV